MCFTFILLHLTENCRNERTFSRPDRPDNDIQRSFYNFQVDVSQLEVSFFPRKRSFDNFNRIFAFPNLLFIECLIVLLFSWQKIAVDSKKLSLSYSILHSLSFYIKLHLLHYSTCSTYNILHPSTSMNIILHPSTYIII